MKILVINAGSSSLKYQLIDMTKKTIMAKGLCERIGIDGKLKHETNGTEVKKDIAMNNHKDAIKVVMDSLTHKDYAVIKSMDEIDAVGHRFAHGADYFKKSSLMTEETMKYAEACIELAPLHNPAHILGINSCREVLGDDVPQVSVFDTVFHQSLPKHAYLYALPYEYFEKYKIRKYGFHGTSHKYVAQRAAAMLDKPLEELKIITCHLGNGSSITAVDKGSSIDTTMGFTPLEGLIMGTRSGSFDPAIITYVMEKEGIGPKEMNDVLNKKSGLLGLSGVSADLRDIERAAENGNERAKVTIDQFCYQVKKYIGSYAAAMGGVDAVVFTAGIGENSGECRKQITDGLEFLGISIDSDKNNTRGKEIDISSDWAKVKTLVVPTNEELMIAMDTRDIVLGLKK